MLNGQTKNQILLRSQGGRRKAEGGSCLSFPLPPSAFTLTELLVVITIIAILASLITAGAMNAMRRSQEAAITLEIGQLADAVERFKTETGGAYPPNSMNENSVVTKDNYAGQSVYQQTVNDFIRSMRKAFPRHNEPEGLLRRLAGQTDATLPGNPTDLDGGMNSAEALCFWLGGFSSDPVYPISGPGGPSFGENNTISGLDPGDEILENRNRTYEFDLTRLAPRDDAGVFDGRSVDYEIDLNGDGDVNDPGDRRRINLWTYTPKGLTSSFAYFDASRYDPVRYDLDLSGVFDSKVYGVKRVREGFSGATPTPADIHFVNKGKYQILHAGLDDAWGNWLPAEIFSANSSSNASNLLMYPLGPFTGEVADTLTNFTTGTLESAQE